MPATLTLTPTEPLSDTQRVAAAAADELFTLYGVVPITVEHVAEHAELTVDELTSAYPTKQLLVVAVLQRWHGAWRHAVERIADAVSDPRDEVLGIFGFLEECFDDASWRGCAFINGHAELGRQDPVIASLAAEHFRDVERHLTLVCARAAMPAQVAQTLTLLVEGARVESAVQQSSQPARTARLGAAMLMSVYATTDRF
ncbi:TetR/AcrR family transcriptional regulator [Curtobacterium sp. ISL-83]|uniref:TetR/AcrR family transcriptional regulator n=1 Tax=Curtobacterium sp. ISL-83 TaxID=2819145 RepID=UPI001BE8D344|nr:TetR/AcrR family transcriptional regulator [Curtobacterium sp. ISL-83]MBT2502209.1 TetR/AcrR family transcriptional regulator [Curtobacterium sp. ISL-83]